MLAVRADLIFDQVKWLFLNYQYIYILQTLGWIQSHMQLFEGLQLSWE